MVLGSGQGQEKQWRNNNEKRRIYSVTDGLKSKQTAKVYRSTFKEFIKYLQNVDLRVLLDFRLDIIESKIISYLEYLRDVRKLSFWSVQVHYSAIHHFFEINDVALNSRKIKKFLSSGRVHFALKAIAPQDTHSVSLNLMLFMKFKLEFKFASKIIRHTPI